MFPCVATTSSIEASLFSPSAKTLTWSHIPGRVHADRPLEIEVAAAGHEPDTGPASVARWLAAHARLTIEVDVEGQHRASYTCSLSVHSSAEGGWLVRALISPSAWANAASITIVSLTLAGRAMSCDCLPATLQIGYNHAPAPEGAVLKAAKAGDVAALQAALDAGGSTEEADTVRTGKQNNQPPSPSPPRLLPRHHHHCYSLLRLAPSGLP